MFAPTFGIFSGNRGLVSALPCRAGGELIVGKPIKILKCVTFNVEIFDQDY